MLHETTQTQRTPDSVAFFQDAIGNIPFDGIERDAGFS